MLEQQFAAEIQHIIDNKTKPLGALGQLEQVALQLALIQSKVKSKRRRILRSSSRRC